MANVKEQAQALVKKLPWEQKKAVKQKQAAQAAARQQAIDATMNGLLNMQADPMRNRTLQGGLSSDVVAANATARTWEEPILGYVVQNTEVIFPQAITTGKDNQGKPIQETMFLHGFSQATPGVDGRPDKVFHQSIQTQFLFRGFRGGGIVSVGHAVHSVDQNLAAIMQAQAAQKK